MPDGLLARLARHGVHRDVAIPPAAFARHRAEFSRTGISLYDAPSYRDDNPRYSVHLTDHRGADTPRADIIAHLEWFNPEHHPFLHALLDFPVWFYRNRIRDPTPAMLTEE